MRRGEEALGDEAGLVSWELSLGLVGSRDQDVDIIH